MDHGAVTEDWKVEAVAVEGDRCGFSSAILPRNAEISSFSVLSPT